MNLCSLTKSLLIYLLLCYGKKFVDSYTPIFTTYYPEYGSSTATPSQNPGASGSESQPNSATTEYNALTPIEVDIKSKKKGDNYSYAVDDNRKVGIYTANANFAFDLVEDSSKRGLLSSPKKIHDAQDSDLFVKKVEINLDTDVPNRAIMYLVTGDIKFYVKQTNNEWEEKVNKIELDVSEKQTCTEYEYSESQGKHKFIPKLPYCIIKVKDSSDILWKTDCFNYPTKVVYDTSGSKPELKVFNDDREITVGENDQGKKSSTPSREVEDEEVSQGPEGGKAPAKAKGKKPKQDEILSDSEIEDDTQPVAGSSKDPSKGEDNVSAEIQTETSQSPSRPNPAELDDSGTEIEIEDPRPTRRSSKLTKPSETEEIIIPDSDDDSQSVVVSHPGRDAETVVQNDSESDPEEAPDEVEVVNSDAESGPAPESSKLTQQQATPGSPVVPEETEEQPASKDFDALESGPKPEPVSEDEQVIEEVEVVEGDDPEPDSKPESELVSEPVSRPVSNEQEPKSTLEKKQADPSEAGHPEFDANVASRLSSSNVVLPESVPTPIEIVTAGPNASPVTNNLNKFHLVERAYGFLFTFTGENKCVQVKYKGVEVWSYTNFPQNEYPESVCMRKDVPVLLFKFKQCFYLYGCDLNKFKMVTMDQFQSAFANIKVITRHGTAFKENDKSDYHMNHYGFIFEYTFKTGVKCVEVKFNDSTPWKHDPAVHGESYPEALYVDIIAPVIVSVVVGDKPDVAVNYNDSWETMEHVLEQKSVDLDTLQDGKSSKRPKKTPKMRSGLDDSDVVQVDVLHPGDEQEVGGLDEGCEEEVEVVDPTEAGANDDEIIVMPENESVDVGGNHRPARGQPAKAVEVSAEDSEVEVVDSDEDEEVEVEGDQPDIIVEKQDGASAGKSRHDAQVRETVTTQVQRGQSKPQSAQKSQRTKSSVPAGPRAPEGRRTDMVAPAGRPIYPRFISCSKRDREVESGGSETPVTLDIRSLKGCDQYDLRFDEIADIYDLRAKPNYIFSKIIRGKSVLHMSYSDLNIWDAPDQDSYSSHIMYKGSKTDAQYLAIVHPDRTFTLLYKSGSDKPFVDYTSTRPSPNDLRMYTKVNNDFREICRNQYTIETKGFTYGFSFNDGVQCDLILSHGLTLWDHESDGANGFPTRVYVSFLTKNLIVEFSNGRSQALDLNKNGFIHLDANILTSSKYTSVSRNDTAKTVTYIPETGYTFGSVSFAGRVLWMAPDSNHASKVILYLLPNDEKKIEIYLTDGVILTFLRSKPKGDWEDVTRDQEPRRQVKAGAKAEPTDKSKAGVSPDSESVSSRDSQPVSPDPSTLLVIDVDSKVSAKEYDYYFDPINKIHNYKCKVPFLIKSVVRGTATFWDARDENYGSKAAFQEIDGHQPRLSVTVPDPGEHVPIVHTVSSRPKPVHSVPDETSDDLSQQQYDERDTDVGQEAASGTDEQPIETGPKPWENKLPIVLSITKDSTDQYDYSKKNGEFGIFVPKHNFIFKAIKIPHSKANVFGNDDWVWSTEKPVEYVTKVIIDGVGTLSTINNITIYQADGNIKHLTKLNKTWIQVTASVVVDLKSERNTIYYDFIKDQKMHTRTYVAKPGVLFKAVKTTEGTVNKTILEIWDAKSKDQFANKVIITGTGKQEKYLIIILPTGSYIILYKSDKNKPWVDETQNGFSQQILTTIGIDLESLAPSTTEDEKEPEVKEESTETPLSPAVVPTKLFRKPLDPSLVPIVLDISKRKETNEYMYYRDYRTNLAFFTPKANIVFKSVSQNNVDIWAGGQGDYSKKVVVRDASIDPENQSVAILLSGDDYLFFNKPNSFSLWEDQTSSRMALSNLKIIAEDPLNPNDLREVTTGGYEMGILGFFYGYTFDHGIKVVQVSLGPDVLWEYSGGALSGYPKGLYLDLLTNQYYIYCFDQVKRLAVHSGEGHGGVGMVGSRAMFGLPEPLDESKINIVTKDQVAFYQNFEDHYTRLKSFLLLTYQFRASWKFIKVEYDNCVVWQHELGVYNSDYPAKLHCDLMGHITIEFNDQWYYVYGYNSRTWNLIDKNEAGRAMVQHAIVPTQGARTRVVITSEPQQEPVEETYDSEPADKPKAKRKKRSSGKKRSRQVEIRKTITDPESQPLEESSIPTDALISDVPHIEEDKLVELDISLSVPNGEYDITFGDNHVEYRAKTGYFFKLVKKRKRVLWRSNGIKYGENVIVTVGKNEKIHVRVECLEEGEDDRDALTSEQEPKMVRKNGQKSYNKSRRSRPSSSDNRTSSSGRKNRLRRHSVDVRPDVTEGAKEFGNDLSDEDEDALYLRTEGLELHVN